MERRRSSSHAGRVTSVDGALNPRPSRLIVFIQQLDDDTDIGQRLVVLDAKDQDERHRRVYRWDVLDMDRVPGSTVDEELRTFYAGGICQHCRRDVHVPQCNT